MCILIYGDIRIPLRAVVSWIAVDQDRSPDHGSSDESAQRDVALPERIVPLVDDVDPAGSVINIYAGRVVDTVVAGYLVRPRIVCVDKPARPPKALAAIG